MKAPLRGVEQSDIRGFFSAEMIECASYAIMMNRSRIDDRQQDIISVPTPVVTVGGSIPLVRKFHDYRGLPRAPFTLVVGLIAFRKDHRREVCTFVAEKQENALKVSIRHPPVWFDNHSYDWVSTVGQRHIALLTS
jgi:hypothetical protein